jgi:hypothetical protein
MLTNNAQLHICKSKCRGLLLRTAPQLAYSISETHETSQDSSNAAGIR